MTDAIDRLTVALTGRYAIEREIGSGGMARVYLADDLRHRRQVAIKVLRPELSATMGAQRFLHEIEIAARLQHPNILPLLDSGDSDGFLYYVMPFIEGQTLRDRLRREGELPVAAAVKLLSEIVDALAEAHRHGVIHRDIKPENVLLTGRHALVADFGVAKAVTVAAGPQHLTTGGMALGTPAYMAPEQATAEPLLDHRVDLYAVGVMAYEMLTGQLPFAGSSAQQLLAAHLTREPEPFGGKRPSVPPALEALVMKCLAKRPADRWQSAEELLGQLEPILATPSGGITPARPRAAAGEPAAPGGRRRSLGLSAAAAVILVAVAAALWSGNGGTDIAFGPVRPLTSEPGVELQPALSPDGNELAYVATQEGRLRVFVRSVDGGTPILLARDLTGDQRSPRWSPDGGRVLFMAGGSIYTTPSLGGSPRMLVSRGSYATWAPDGRQIAYVLHDTLFVRGLEGGIPRRLTTGFGLHSPAWSPDGKFIAYVANNPTYWTGGENLGNLAPSILMVIPASGGDSIKLSVRKYLHMSPVWAPDSRHLLFMSTQDGGRDLYSLELSGSGRPRAQAVRLTTGLDIGTFSLSADGRLLAYSAFTNASNIWAFPVASDRVLSEDAAVPVTTGSQHIEGVSVSHDGKWLAFASDRQGNSDIYRMPIAGGTPQQITTDPSYDFVPSWSPDDTEIVFHSWRNETRDLFVVPVAGGEEQMIAGGPAMEMFPNWSPDGLSVLFDSDRSGRAELYVVDRGVDGRWSEPRQLTRTGGNAGRWSPDGRAIVHDCPQGLCLVSPQASAPRLLVSYLNSDPELQFEALSGVWSPDSRTVYFKATSSDGRSSFWAIPAEGGRPKLLARFDQPTFSSPRSEFATDGKRFYFTADDPQSDLKLMEVRWPE